jgi:phage N-6-adenine-methyltransferase
MNTDLMFSSATDQWATPQAFFDQWNSIFHFDLDVCADATNAKCPRYFTREDNGLAQDWGFSVCWMNPPYGREIGRWVQKAYNESLGGATVVCLLPARTDTAWWHTYVIPCAKVHFIRGRLKFGTATNSAPFPSAVAVFYPPKVAG